MGGSRLPASPLCVLFPRVAALCRRLRRFSKFSDGGLPFLEPIPYPSVARRSGRIPRRYINKDMAKRTHAKLLRRINPLSDGIVYTDGSAVLNPGKTGFGVAFNFNGDTLTISSPIGIGSILTAELFEIRAALTKLQSLVLDGRLLSFRRVLLFSDCQIAIEIINGNVYPTGDFELVSAIKTLAKSLRPKIQVDILWVPAHVGVCGNELADNAAKRDPMQ